MVSGSSKSQKRQWGEERRRDHQAGVLTVAGTQNLFSMRAECP